MLIKVNEKSRLELPKDIVEALDIKEGDKVEITTREGGVFIRPIALLSKSKFEKINKIIQITDKDKAKRTWLDIKGNAAFKATLRQPVRMIIFVLLVGLATFGFVSRVVEFAVLNREINRIEHFYRTAGALIPIDPFSINNAYEAVNILSNSPLIDFHDRRTITQGVMHGHASGLRGFRTVGGNIFQRGEPPYEYKDLYPFETFLVVEVLARTRRNLFLPDTQEIVETVRLSFMPGQVLIGHEQFFPRRYMADMPIDENGNSVADNVQWGGHYMVRASRQSAVCNTMEIFPIIDDIYFVSIDDHETLNRVWSTLSRELQILEENTNMLMLQGTKDMTVLPMVQSGVMERRIGRLLTYNDYENANHVMVVPYRLERLIGETVTLTLRDMRTFIDGSPMPPLESHMRRHIIPGVEGLWANIPAGYWVSIPRGYEGNWRRYPTVEIDVMVVGSYHVSGMWALPRWAHIRNSFRNMEAFVPASVIPEGFGIVDAHIVSGAYSFVLNSPMDRPAFTVRYGGALADLGFMIQFSGEDPVNFWRSAGPIRNAIQLNLVLFSAVLAVVLALTVFVYLRQRYKDFAIMRAMGVSDGSATGQTIMPVLLLWLPVVIIASVFAWQFALNQVDTSMEILAEVDIPYDMAEEHIVRNILELMRHEEEMAQIQVASLFGVLPFIGLTLVVTVVWVLAVFAGVRFFAGQSMILLLQSAQGVAAVRMRMAKETAPPKGIKIADVFLLSPIVRSGFNRTKSAIRHHWRHILRAPVKSLLVVGMALLFILALGWLDRTITVTENEIERLYATTPITGEIVQLGVDEDGFGFVLQNIPRSAVNILIESGFVEEIYYTFKLNFTLFSVIELPSGVALDWDLFNRGAIIPPPEPLWDMVKSFSSWDTFVYLSSRPVAFGMGLGDEFEITFAPGYSEEDFVLGGVTPVIVHESLLERDIMVVRHGLVPYDPNLRPQHKIEQRLSLGDMAFLGHPWEPNALSVRIIGVYSGGHPRSAYHMGQGLILIPQHGIRGQQMTTLSFAIYQDKAIHLNEFEYYMEEALLALSDIGYFRANVNDEELTMVVTPLEENLNLLRMLYPVARVVSFVLALGLSLLLMLQNAKNAAILRMFGMPRYKTRFNLCAELLIISIAGAAVGFVTVLFMGVGINTAGLLVGIYLAGALVGVFAGVLVISHKPPMDLLQVRE